jgi:hypothetical protein
LINQAVPQLNAATGRAIVPKGTRLFGSDLVGQNWHSGDNLVQIAAPLPTTATGYTILWVGPINVPSTTTRSVIRSTGGGFRFEPYSTVAGAYLTLTHSGLANTNPLSAANWTSSNNSPFVFLASYNGTSVLQMWRVPPGADLGVGSPLNETTTTVGMNAGTGTIDLSATGGSFGAYLTGYAARPMSHALMRRLLRNPWQVFAPEREVFYSLGGTQSLTVTPSGGMRLGGAGPVLARASWTAAGGILLSGAATPVRRAQPATSGGLLVGGAADYSTSTGTQSYAYTASGGVRFGGTAERAYGRVVDPTGGMRLGGTAPVTTSGLQSLEVVPAGGILVGGTALVSRGRSAVAAGGVLFGGIAGYSSRESQRVVIASGGILFGGSAPRIELTEVTGARRGVWGRYGILDIRRGKAGI